jgi:hypothetical protein
MAHGGNPRVEHKRPWPKWTYARTVLPLYAKRGGAAWADDYARLPVEEQWAIRIAMSVGCARANARRYGHPDPIITEVTVRPLQGGGYTAVPGSGKNGAAS